MSGKTKTKIPEELLNIIREKGRFVLLTHIHPDGDALGSLLGMAEVLRSLGKKVLCFAEEPVSHLYDFLPDCEKICNDLDEVFGFIAQAESDVVTISLDCGEADRLGTHKVEFLNNRPFLVIDHHKSHKNHGDYRWVEPGSSSTGEMVYEIAMELGVDIGIKCAYNLYVAISTDTGSFKYEATTPRTLQIASDLVARGVRPEEVAIRVYDNYSLERLKMLELVLETLELHVDDQVAFIFATNEMFEKSGATYQDIEGFVDYARSLKFVKVAGFIKETSTGMISVSLRAKGECDVTEVAKVFDGGGHRNAAGFRFKDKSIDEVRTEVLDVLKKSLYVVL